MVEALIESFERELEAGRLLGSKCKGCGAAFTPPRPLCSRCGGETQIQTFKGEGVIEAFTVIHVAPWYLAEAAPYILALVRLEEGALILGRLQGFDPNKPEEIPVGGRVKLEPLKEKHGEKEVVIPAFKPL